MTYCKMLCRNSLCDRSCTAFRTSINDTNGPGLLSRYNDSPWVGRSGDRNPVAARFSAPDQTGPGAHPVHAVGTVSFPGVKRPGRGVNHSLQSSVEVEGRVEL